MNTLNEIRFDDKDLFFNDNIVKTSILPQGTKDLKINILLFFMLQELHGTSRNCIMIFRNWRSWRNRELLLCQLRFVSLILQFFQRR